MRQHVYAKWTEFKSIVVGRDGAYVGYWEALMPNGEAISVPCVYSQKDVEKNTHQKLLALVEAIMRNGLESLIDLIQHYHIHGPFVVHVVGSTDIEVD